MQSTEDTGTRKILSAVSHGAIFFSTFVLSIGVPIVIYVLSNDSVVKESAKESINFHFNVWLYSVIFGLLTFVLIGWPLLAILWIAQLVLPILAIIHSISKTDTAYRYPLIFRLF
ncbi:MAG: DUF4870 domain-containing protein [Shackletoniella antarctica]|jgi:hypothetical protein|uniref:DUF4870 domain-containing protein n=1 Tax=Shackletoniella antarctica TaxID=268115 RepID=A0A2W4Y6X6_9CYAN|nr:MAG: DUF4870 domain-containing protein [Shackletoniella antarctica]